MDCKKKYVGELARCLKKQIYGYIRVCETHPNFNSKDSKMLVYKHNKKYRKNVKSSVISNFNTMKERWGFFFPIVSLFGQISIEKLQNPKFEIIHFHRSYVYIVHMYTSFI